MKNQKAIGIRYGTYLKLYEMKAHGQSFDGVINELIRDALEYRRIKVNVV